MLGLLSSLLGGCYVLFIYQFLSRYLRRLEKATDLDMLVYLCNLSASGL